LIASPELIEFVFRDMTRLRFGHFHSRLTYSTPNFNTGRAALNGYHFDGLGRRAALALLRYRDCIADLPG